MWMKYLGPILARLRGQTPLGEDSPREGEAASVAMAPLETDETVPAAEQGAPDAAALASAHEARRLLESGDPRGALKVARRRVERGEGGRDDIRVAAEALRSELLNGLFDLFFKMMRCNIDGRA